MHIQGDTKGCTLHEIVTRQDCTTRVVYETKTDECMTAMVLGQGQRNGFLLDSLLPVQSIATSRLASLIKLDTNVVESILELESSHYSARSDTACTTNFWLGGRGQATGKVVHFIPHIQGCHGSLALSTTYRVVNDIIVGIVVAVQRTCRGM
jgi:hypothetical protein